MDSCFCTEAQPSRFGAHYCCNQAADETADPDEDEDKGVVVGADGHYGPVVVHILDTVALPADKAHVQDAEGLHRSHLGAMRLAFPHTARAMEHTGDVGGDWAAGEGEVPAGTDLCAPRLLHLRPVDSEVVVDDIQ